MCGKLLSTKNIVFHCVENFVEVSAEGFKMAIMHEGFTLLFLLTISQIMLIQIIQLIHLLLQLQTLVG